MLVIKDDTSFFTAAFPVSEPETEPVISELLKETLDELIEHDIAVYHHVINHQDFELLNESAKLGHSAFIRVLISVLPPHLKPAAESAYYEMMEGGAFNN